MDFTLVEINPGTVALYKNLFTSSTFELIHSQRIKNNKNLNRILTNSELNRYHDAIEYCIDKVMDLGNIRIYTRGDFSSMEVSGIRDMCFKSFGIYVLELNQMRESQVIINYLKNRKLYFWFEKEIIKIGYSSSNRFGFYQTIFRYSNVGGLAELNLFHELLLYNIDKDVDTVIYNVDPEVFEISSIHRYIELLGAYFDGANLLQGEDNFPTIYNKYLNPTK